MNSNEFTVKSRFLHEFNHEDVFEVTIKSGNGAEIKTRAYLSAVNYYLDGFQIPYYDYTFLVNDRINE